MRRTLLARLALSSSLVLAACGGGAPPAAPTTIAPVASASAPQPVAAQPDTSAVSMPPNVVLVIRASNASATADKLSRWTKMPLSPLAILGSDRAAQVVDLSQPLDFVVALKESAHGKPEPIMATSAALRSLDDAKRVMSEKNDLIPAENGVIKLAPKSRASKPVGPDQGDDGDDDDDTKRCAIAPSYGPAPLRLVCADSESALARLMGYLSRGVTRIPVTGDVHVEAYAAPARQTATALRARSVGSLLRELSNSPASGDLVASYDPFEFFLDMDHATLDAKLDDTAADVSLSIAFREKQSAFTRAFTSHPDRADAPPPAFFRLPVDSDLALYSRGLDATDLEKATRLAPDALAEVLAGGKMPQADARAFATPLHDSLAALPGPIVYARGVDVTASRAALDAWRSAKDEASKQRAAKVAVQKLAGWEVFGLDAPLGTVGPNVKAYGAALARPGFAKWFKDDSGGMAPPTLKQAAPIAGLPSDAQHYEVTFPHRDYSVTVQTKTPPVTFSKLHIVLLADQGHTWVIDAMDDATLAAKAKGLLPAAPDTGTLAKRAGLDTLRSTRSNAGGAFDVRGIGLELPIMRALGSPTHIEGGDPLGGMQAPAQGGTLIPLTFTESAPTDGMAASLTFATHVPKEAVVDFIVTADQLFR